MTQAYDYTDGLIVGKSKHRSRFVRFPDGRLRAVDRDFDRTVFSDPDSLSHRNATPSPVDVTDIESIPEVKPVIVSVHAIAKAILGACPNALVAMAHDSRELLIAATITRFVRCLTAATFRQALRGLPDRCKSVTFAARSAISNDIRDAATIAAECHLIAVLGFIIAD